MVFATNEGSRPPFQARHRRLLRRVEPLRDYLLKNRLEL